MFKTTFRSLMLCAAVTLALPALAADDEKVTEDRVVATVNGANIYYSEILEAQSSLGQQMQAMPVEMIQGLLINSIADRKLVAQQARKEKLDQTETYKRRFLSVQEQILHREFLTKYAKAQFSDEKIKVIYDKMVNDFKPTSGINARHILVKTEDEAKELIKALEGGIDFIELAKKKSIGPSGPAGGDLGFFGPGSMVPAFEKAAFSLKEGEFTKEAVETQYGWHIIKVEFSGMSSAPEFKAVVEQIKGQIANDAVTKYLTDLRKGAKIVLLNKDGTEMKIDK